MLFSSKVIVSITHTDLHSLIAYSQVWILNYSFFPNFWFVHQVILKHAYMYYQIMLFLCQGTLEKLEPWHPMATKLEGFCFKRGVRWILPKFSFLTKQLNLLDKKLLYFAKHPPKNGQARKKCLADAFSLKILPLLHFSKILLLPNAPLSMLSSCTLKEV